MSKYLMNVLVALSIVLGLGTMAPSAQADIILADRTAPENWQGLAAPIFHYRGSVASGNAPVALIGNGNRLSTIGLIWGHSSSGGAKNGGNIEGLDWSFMLFNGNNDFIQDPYGDNRPNGWHYEFGEPTNSNWREIIGVVDGWNMRYAEFDVNFLNLTLNQGAQFLASVQPSAPNGGGGNIVTNIAFANGGVGLDLDWYNSTAMGPNTLQALGAPYDYAAWRVTTVTVPAPAPAVLSAIAVLATCNRRRPSNNCVSSPNKTVPHP